jgi:hypothetical protein
VTPYSLVYIYQRLYPEDVTLHYSQIRETVKYVRESRGPRNQAMSVQAKASRNLSDRPTDRPADGGRRLLQNACKYLPEYTASHLTRQYFILRSMIVCVVTPCSSVEVSGRFCDAAPVRVCAPSIAPLRSQCRVRVFNLLVV